MVYYLFPTPSSPPLPQGVSTGLARGERKTVLFFGCSYDSISLPHPFTPFFTTGRIEPLLRGVNERLSYSPDPYDSPSLPHFICSQGVSTSFKRSERALVVFSGCWPESAARRSRPHRPLPRTRLRGRQAHCLYSIGNQAYWKGQFLASDRSAPCFAMACFAG